MEEELQIPKSKYLQRSQIDAIKMEMDSMEEGNEGFVRLFSMIDNYIRINGTADGEYEAVFTLVTTLDLMQSSQMDYDASIKATFPIISAISFYDYLVVTGVLTPDDVKKFREGLGDHFPNGGGIPTA